MSLSARGVYIDMLAVMWMHGPLPDDKDAVSDLVGCDIDEGDWSIVRKKFFSDGGKLLNERLMAVLDEVVQKTNKSRENGRKGAAVRYGKGLDADGGAIATPKPPHRGAMDTLKPPHSIQRKGKERRGDERRQEALHSSSQVQTSSSSSGGDDGASLGERIEGDPKKRTIANAVRNHCDKRLWTELFGIIGAWPPGDWIWKAYQGWRPNIDKARSPGAYLAKCIRNADAERGER